MPALVAQTQASKQHAEELRVQHDASAEELQFKVQDIVSLRVSFLCPMAAQALFLFVNTVCLRLVHVGLASNTPS